MPGLQGRDRLESAYMRRVLIVEDDATLLDVLRMAFTQSGWEVATAQSLAEAMTRFAEERPQVVITDKNLPGGAIAATQAGVELVRQIRAQDPDVGIALMTAYGTAESARDTLNLGVDEYLEKPFANVFAVVDRMAELADRSRTPQKKAAALTIIIAATAERQRAIAGALGGSGDRVLGVDNPEAIRPSAKHEHADVVILDGGSFPEEITCLAVTVKTRARDAACVVLSQDLPLGDIKRLIELEVKALVDPPLESPQFAAELRAALARLRR
jgi:DNA-binding response OmpR family regulator